MLHVCFHQVFFCFSASTGRRCISKIIAIWLLSDKSMCIHHMHCWYLEQERKNHKSNEKIYCISSVWTVKIFRFVFFLWQLVVLCLSDGLHCSSHFTPGVLKSSSSTISPDVLSICIHAFPQNTTHSTQDGTADHLRGWTCGQVHRTGLTFVYSTHFVTTEQRPLGAVRIPHWDLLQTQPILLLRPPTDAWTKQAKIFPKPN